MKDWIIFLVVPNGGDHSPEPTSTYFKMLLNIMGSKPLIILILLTGRLFYETFGASTRFQSSENEPQIKENAVQKFIQSEFIVNPWDDFELYSPTSKLGFGDIVNNSTASAEGLRQHPRMHEYLKLKPQHATSTSKVKRQKHHRHHESIQNQNSIPIELESFTGDTLEGKLTLLSSEKSSFLDWLNEIERESQKVEKLMKIEKRTHSGHHLRTCDTEYGWRNLGRDHYPQFIRTATCSAPNCYSDLYRCVPRQYTLKVLKKLEPDEVVDPATAVKLPEALRSSVKFINVTTNICCECSLT